MDAFYCNDDGVYLHTRYDGRLFNLARLQANTNVWAVNIRETLFANDTALATYTEPALQSKACGPLGPSKW